MTDHLPPDASLGFSRRLAEALMQASRVVTETDGAAVMEACSPLLQCLAMILMADPRRREAAYLEAVCASIGDALFEYVSGILAQEQPGQFVQ